MHRNLAATQRGRYGLSAGTGAIPEHGSIDGLVGVSTSGRQFSADACRGTLLSPECNQQEVAKVTGWRGSFEISAGRSSFCVGEPVWAHRVYRSCDFGFD